MKFSCLAVVLATTLAVAPVSAQAPEGRTPSVPGDPPVLTLERTGLSREAAVVEAGAIRLRPIIMTTITTACGMLPLALGIGQGSELMQPLALAVVGGLTVSTLLTLFVVPSAYIILNNAADRLVTWLTGHVPEPVGPASAPVPEPTAAVAREAVHSS